jgi:hypothetical protein
MPSKVTPSQRKALSQAHTWGHLTEREGKIYSRESDEEPVCTKVTVRAAERWTACAHLICTHLRLSFDATR